jgi:hypothetical protein
MQDAEMSMQAASASISLLGLWVYTLLKFNVKIKEDLCLHLMVDD